MLTILRSIIQPRLDYCSQLWSPCDQMSINRLEAIQRRFLSQIRDRELTSLNYWEKLEHLNVLSQERRRERFQICFIWKLSQDLCEGYDIQWQWSERRGRFAVPAPVKRTATAKVKRAKERSLRVHGAQLFNLLPMSLRNENSGDYELFKNHLDLYLKGIPDQPTTAGLTRAANSNSLLHQIPLCQDVH